MKLARVVRAVLLGALIALSTGQAGAAVRTARRDPTSRSLAYIHERVREQVREEAEVRVVVVMGDPAFPQTWARDWRERGPAIRELAWRVRRDAPRFRVTTEYSIFPFLAGAVDADGLEELAASRFVEGIYPDRVYHAALAESGPLIGRPEAESRGYDGDGVTVAVLDTGIAYTHSDLGGSATPFDFPNAKVIGGTNIITPSAHPMDDNGHGTNVAGVVAGEGPTYRGIAPKAKLVSVKVLNNYGAGLSSGVVSGIEWCIVNRLDHNIRVINLSLGDSAEWRDPEVCDDDPYEGRAIREAVEAGMVVVAASGNSSYTGGVAMPACSPYAMAVGATYDAGLNVDKPAGFSNRGELLSAYAPGITITAPRWSGDAYGTGPYYSGAGTSFAAPHVAGAAAIMWQRLGGGATPAQVRSRLERTGVQILDPATGVAAPRVDLVRAIDNVPTAGPDLIVTGVTCSASSGFVGDAVTVSISVKNQGDAASTTCKAIVAASANKVASPQDYAIATISVPALAAGENWTSETVSGAIPGASPGAYSVVGFVDSLYQVAEKDETNNGRLGASLQISGLSSYVFSTSIPASLLKGQSAQVSVTIRNGSSVSWTNAGGYALAAASPLDNNTWGVSRVPLPALSVAPGADATFTFTVTAPATAGRYACHWQMVRGDVPFGEVATGGERVRVFDDAEWGQQYPAVGAEWVAYVDYSGQNPVAIGARSLTTGGVLRLPDSLGLPATPPAPYRYLTDFETSHWFPDVSGNWVVWMADDYPTGLWYFQILAQDLAAVGSALPLRVTYQSADAWWPAIDGTFVVWEDYRHDPDGVPSFDFIDDRSVIYVSDLSAVAGTTDKFPPSYPLCIPFDAEGPQLAPRISYPYVVWEDWRDGFQADLYLYDLSVDSNGNGIPNWKDPSRPDPDPACIRLTDTEWSEQFPDISGSKVVWLDLRRDTGLPTYPHCDVYLADINSPTPVVVADDPPTWRYQPRIQWPVVVWEDWRNDADGPSEVGSIAYLSDNPDIYWHHARTGLTAPLAATTTAEEWPAIFGDTVVWSKLRTVISDWWGDWPVFNIWAHRMHPQGLVGVGSFSDVGAAFWAWDYIEAAVANGVVRGYEDGTYQPANTVTRDQMAVYIARAIAGGDEGVGDGPLTATFPDVPNTGYGPEGTDPHWAYRYVEFTVSNRVVGGYEDGTYQPLGAVDRGQMAVFISRSRGWVDMDDDMTTAPTLFPDVPAGFWAGTAVQACVQNGVVRGYPDGLYRPLTTVTRDQMAVFISRAFGYVSE